MQYATIDGSGTITIGNHTSTTSITSSLYVDGDAKITGTLTQGNIKNIIVRTNKTKTVVAVPTNMLPAFRKGLVLVQYTIYHATNQEETKFSALLADVKQDRVNGTLRLELPSVPSLVEANITLTDISTPQDFEPEIIIR